MIKKRIMLFAVGVFLSFSFTGCSFGRSQASDDRHNESQNTANESRITESSTKGDDVKPEENAVNKKAPNNGEIEKLHPEIINHEVLSTGNDSKGKKWFDLVRLNYSEINLVDEENDKYTALAKALKNFSREEAINLLSQQVNMLNDSLSMYKNSGINDSFFNGVYDGYSYNILRADSKVFSIQKNGKSYMGGSHGYYYSCGICFNSQTGERLKLDDIVKDKNKLAKVVYDNLMKEYKEQIYPEVDINKVLDHLNENNQHIDYWILEPNSITIFFNPYDISAFCAGMQIVTLPFDKYKELFNADYFGYMNDFICIESSAHVDVNGDVEADSIYARLENNGNLDNIEAGNMITITINNKDHQIPLDLPGYECSSYLVRKAEKTYLYVFIVAENDYHYLNVYSLFGDKPNLIGHIDNVDSDSSLDFKYSEKPGKNIQGIAVVNSESISSTSNIIDTDSFYMSSSLNCLGTHMANRRYKVGDNGKPISIDKDYRIAHFGYRLMLNKAPISASEVDENGRVIAKDVIIPIGTQLLVYRTDDKFYCDLKTPEGKIMRVNMDNSVWPHKLNGKDENIFFDMLSYAG